MKRFILIEVIFIALMVTSCAPNVVEVRKGAIIGYGGTQHPPFRSLELIGELDVNLRNMANEDKTNLWIELAGGIKMAFDTISIQQVQRYSALEYTNHPSPEIIYFVDGYTFTFDSTTPTHLTILQYGWPPHQTNVFSRVGSYSSRLALTLPCTLKQFEEVFGKPDRIDRKWVN
jgi:hypothetical protein